MTQAANSGRASLDAQGGLNETKGWILADWFVREMAPTWVSLTGLDDAVSLLTELPPIRSSSEAGTARRHLAVVTDLVDGVRHAAPGSDADRAMAADIVLSVIEGLTVFADAAAQFAGSEAGDIAKGALTLSALTGTTFLIAGIHSAPTPFRNNKELLSRALRSQLQPTIDATSLKMTAIGDRVREVENDLNATPLSSSDWSQSKASEEPSVTDYTFPDENPYLRDVTFRTALIDGRLHGKLIGTYDRQCEYSVDDSGVYTDRHLIDVSTDYVDLETVTGLPHRVALIPESQEIREFFVFPMVLRAEKTWDHDDCPHKPAYEARVQRDAEAARGRAEARAKAPPGVTSYGTAMTPAFDSLDETAAEDGELAARAIDYASRFGRTRRVPGHEVAERYYEALNRDPGEWNDLCFALGMSARADRWIAVAQQFGPDAVPQVAGPYCAAFRTQLERHLHRLGGGGWPIEDPTGAIAPWLQLLAALERDAKPSLLRRIFGRRG